MADEKAPAVVVGVDGSDGSKAALDWAADYAATVSAPVELVITWHYPVAYGTVPMVGLDTDFEEMAAKVVSGMAGEAQRLHPEVVFTTKVIPGPAAEALIREAKGARLLVVGSRGHGAFTGMLIGSVSTHCVRHARCPVVVVR
ncbi:MAG TPA: universal stress protein [Acidimicrobiales bacterium]|nr:universal stress protein [Acidimicrobiales bacterium]